MRMYDLIRKKRDGLALTGPEIGFFVDGYVRGEVYERTHPRPAVIENDRRRYSQPRKNYAAGPKSASR